MRRSHEVAINDHRRILHPGCTGGFGVGLHDEFGVGDAVVEPRHAMASNDLRARCQHRPAADASDNRHLDKFGHPCARGILDHVAGVEDLFLAKATYDAACKRWPGKMIILPHGALVLEESRKTPLALREDANATYSESGLPKCNARHRRKRRAGTKCSPSERVHHGTGVCWFARKRPNAVRYGSCGRHPRRSFVWRLSRKDKRIGEMPGWAGQQANWCKLVEVHSGAARGAA